MEGKKKCVCKQKLAEGGTAENAAASSPETLIEDTQVCIYYFS